jgi:hypothetical protein
MYNIQDADLIHKNLLELLDLKDATGKSITDKDLQVHRVLLDRASRLVNGYYLYPSSGYSASKITIQIRPVIGQDNAVNQLMFILSEDNRQNHLSHQDLSNAFIKQQGLKEQIFNKLSLDGRNMEVIKLFEILNNVEQDIFIATEIEDHGIRSQNTLPDLAYVCKKIVFDKRKLASDQGVNLYFNLPPTEELEKVRLQLIDENLTKNALPISNFFIPMDEKWFRILISELLNLTILLSSSSVEKQVKLEVSHSGKDIMIAVFTSAPVLTNNDINGLFVKYYPLLQNKLVTKIASGLEGYLTKEIATRLNIPLQVDFSTQHFSTQPIGLIFKFALPFSRKQ